MDKHKPISDALRKALQGLDIGDTRAALLQASTTKSSSTSKPPTLRQLNARVLQTRAMTRKEREEEAARLAIERRPKYPDARVMFMEHTLCLSCGTESEGISHPQIFLRLRSMQGNKFDPGAITYVPEKEYVDFPGAKLPRLIEHHTTKVSSCPKCFTNAVHSFRGESIGSSQLAVSESTQLSSGETSDSPSSKSTSSPSSTDDGGKSGILTSPDKGMEKTSLTTSCETRSFDSTSSASEPPPAPAQPISSLIIEERVGAKETGPTTTPLTSTQQA